MNQYQKENEELFYSFLRQHCFKGKVNPTGDSLELIVTSACNTSCSYCYYKNFSHLSYPFSIQKTNDIIDNLKKVIEWDKLNGFQFKDIDIFSGEFFNLPYYKEILDYLLEETPYLITIPTNGTFAFSDQKTQEISDLLKKYRSRIHLSISIDGKFLDNETRALKNGKEYNDEFYDRLFTFTSYWGYGFHPMIGPKGIKNWIKNYEWFIDMIKLYYKEDEIEARRKIYLLEVRNPDWKPEELKDLQEFITYLLDRNLKLTSDQEFIENYLNSRYVNILGRIPSIATQGIPCSIQTTFAVRLGDLALVPCHRTAYPGYICGKLSFEGKDMKIALENPNLWMAIKTINYKESIRCADCPINYLCGYQCLGCSLEIHADPLVPVVSVCFLEMTITKTIVKFLDEKNLLPFLYKTYFKGKNRSHYQRKKWSQIENLRRKMDELEY